MTPVWVPLVVAAVGVVGTVAGTVVGVLLAQRRADAREATTWERERERERERWAREDTARTFEHRRDAYVQFYEAVRGMAFDAYNRGMGLSDERELAEGWQLPTYRRLQHLRIYAAPVVADAADTAYNRAWWWAHTTRFDVADNKFEQSQIDYDAAETALLEAIRLDLAIPND